MRASARAWGGGLGGGEDDLSGHLLLQDLRIPHTPSRALPSIDSSHASPFRSRQNGATGLIAAAQNGHEAMVRLLLEHKADPSAADQVRIQSSASLFASLLLNSNLCISVSVCVWVCGSAWVYVFLCLCLCVVFKYLFELMVMQNGVTSLIADQNEVVGKLLL